MTTAKPDQRTIVRDDPTSSRRLGWLIVAIITGWMTATLVAVLAVAIRVAREGDVIAVTVFGTGLWTVVLFGRFWRLSRIDEPLVVALVACWSVTAILLSL